MKKNLGLILIVMIISGMLSGAVTIKSYAAETKVVKKETIAGKTYDLGEKDAYDTSKAQEVKDSAKRLYVEGDISEVSTQNGFVCYAVKSDNLKIFVDDKFGKDLFENKDSKKWHIITDKSKTVDSAKLSENVGSGAIIVQTSKDGKTWVNMDSEVDIYNKADSINKRTVAGEEIEAFYKATNVQLTNGCYYRFIVAYKLEREVEPLKVLFVDVKNTEEKERIEVYQFYAYDPSVNKKEQLNKKDAYEFSDVKRVESNDGFKNAEDISSDDPHNDWIMGRFYVSGYTSVKKDDKDIPVFLKVPGDRAALWFDLEQQIDKCNGQSDIKVDVISDGSDIHFGTPTIKNVGRGMLIIRKINKNNKKERQIYTNYLEASATSGANTRVDLFEEGDYEVALDYQLHYDKPFVFKTTTTKTLAYRVYFEFKIRNGNIDKFIRRVDDNSFVSNSGIAENGFYIDVANSQYLDIHIKREILTDSMDGIVEDNKFSGMGKEGRNYTDEGIYTVTISNSATGDSESQRVYVGKKDIMRVHMKTGMPINEINELLKEEGAYIENDQIIIPEPEPEPEPEIEIQNESESVGEVNTDENGNDAEEKKNKTENVDEAKANAAEAKETTENKKDVATQNKTKEKKTEKSIDNKTNTKATQASNKQESREEENQTKKSPSGVVIIVIIIVVGVASVVAYKNKERINSMIKKGGDDK